MVSEDGKLVGSIFPVRLEAKTEPAAAFKFETRDTRRERRVAKHVARMDKMADDFAALVEESMANPTEDIVLEDLFPEPVIEDRWEKCYGVKFEDLIEFSMGLADMGAQPRQEAWPEDADMEIY